jgi:hypothetical protein
MKRHDQKREKKIDAERGSAILMLAVINELIGFFCLFFVPRFVWQLRGVA